MPRIGASITMKHIARALLFAGLLAAAAAQAPAGPGVDLVAAPGAAAAAGGNSTAAAGANTTAAAAADAAAAAPAAATGCAAGKGGANCTACAVGTYSAGSATMDACKPCPSNATTVSTGATSAANCTVCNPGFGGPGCTSCPVGTFSTGGNKTVAKPACKPCPTGFKTASAGSPSAANCSVCAPGYGGPNCTACNQHSYSAGGNRTLPQPECMWCPYGFMTLANRSTSASACSICMPGAAGPKCTPCVPGSYSPGGNATVARPSKCQQCPANSTTKGWNPASVADCNGCIPGYGANNATSSGCAICPKGYYSTKGTGADYLSKTACAKCPVDHTTASAGAVMRYNCTAPPLPGQLWAGPCPSSWPAGFKGVGIAITVRFNPSATANCSKPAFNGSAARVGNATADMFAAFLPLMAQENTGQTFNPGYVNATKAVSCSNPTGGAKQGVAQAIVYVVQTDFTQISADEFGEDAAFSAHFRDACVADYVDAYGTDDQAALFNAYCSSVGGGARAASAIMCVRNASADDVDFYGNAPSSCFPGDAEMDLVDPTTGAPRGAVRMDEARVGDAVRCLVPSNVAAGDARDGAQAYAPGVCRVFGYLDADKARKSTFVALHYTDEGGRPRKLRASPEHLVYLAPAGLAASRQPLDQLPPGGAAARADKVRPGDALAVASEREAGSFFVARVTDVTREVHQGNFAPALTNAGLPLVDGAAAFSWVHLTPETEPHPMQNIGEYFRHIRYVRDFEASLASGCAGATCPCLDAPDDPSRRCVRLGDRLADLPAGKSDYTARSYAALAAAHAQGRTYSGYETGIAIGRVYGKWATDAERMLGIKPHTVGIWVTNTLLAAPAGRASAASGVKPGRGPSADATPTAS